MDTTKDCSKCGNTMGVMCDKCYWCEMKNKMTAKRTDYNTESIVKNTPILRHKLSYGRLLGEYIGTLEGICANDIPNELKVKLELKIKELKEK